MQLTWQDNCEKMGRVPDLGGKLFIHPEKVLESETPYAIVSYGMRHGSFTCKKLGAYLNDDGCACRNARHTITGLDKCDEIMGYAEKLEAFPNDSLIE